MTNCKRCGEPIVGGAMDFDCAVAAVGEWREKHRGCRHVSQNYLCLVERDEKNARKKGKKQGA